MPLPRSIRPWLKLVACIAVIYAAYMLFIDLNQRSFLYFPSHRTADTPLQPWLVGNQIIGYCRVVEKPRTVWLMTHGNGGQADGRSYVLSHLSREDSLYVLEYPGYGLRAGEPSKESINQAALEAYETLRKEAGQTPVCAIGESIGSGPASFLATLPRPPDKIVLIVPFDNLASVAADHMPLLPVKLMLKDDWDNVAALKNYAGPIVIYGAIYDQVIGFQHAKNLAAQLKRARFVEIPGDHNDWSASEQVRIER